MGLVYENVEVPWVKSVIVVECVARAMKSIMQERMRELTKSNKYRAHLRFHLLSHCLSYLRHMSHLKKAMIFTLM